MYDSEMLKKLVRFEVDPIFFTEGHQEEEIFDLEKYVGSYKPTYQDLVVACENMIKAGVDWTSLVNWYCFVSDELADHYEGVWEAAPDRGYLGPNNDYDQFKAMDSAINWMEIYGDIYESVENISEGLQDVIQMAENYQYNKGLEPVEWRLTQSQRVEILEEFSEGTDGVSNSRKELFRRIVDEECAKENHLAMRIKGYGCYGGDRVFACDWEESRKWITKLFEKTGNPYYANTLGYIYYYGRCNDKRRRGCRR